MVRGQFRTMEVGIASKDEWFQSLSSDARHLFYAIWDTGNMRACGAAEITLKTLGFEMNLSLSDLEAALADLTQPFAGADGTEYPRAMWWPRLNVVWLRSFYKHQRAGSSWKFAVAARKSLLEFPGQVREAILAAYPELDTVVVDGPDGFWEATDNLQIPDPPPPEVEQSRSTKGVKKDKPTLVWPAGFDLSLLWQLCQLQQPKVPIAWNYGQETKAVNAMLVKQPDATEEELARFLGYLRHTFPFNREPHRQVKFSAAKVEQFLNWWGAGKPEKPQEGANGRGASVGTNGRGTRLSRDEATAQAVRDEMEYRKSRQNIGDGVEVAGGGRPAPTTGRGVSGNAGVLA